MNNPNEWDIEHQVELWMKQRVGDFTDLSGLVNATRMAEDCAIELDIPDDEGENIPEFVFNIAAEIADSYERWFFPGEPAEIDL